MDQSRLSGILYIWEDAHILHFELYVSLDSLNEFILYSHFSLFGI